MKYQKSKWYSYCLNNPLKFADDDGESFILVAALIGAWIGMANAIENSDKQGWGLAGDMGKGFVIGGAAGASGAWVGGAVAGALGTASTFGGAVANGALSGATGGFAGGFVGGAGSSWLGGANFGQGLQQGLTVGGYGAILGGAIGGIAGGIQYGNQLSLFRKGNDGLGIQSGDPVPASDDFLSRSQKSWYPDAPMENVVKFTVENVPANHQAALDANGAAARTAALSKGGVFTGKSNVYFNRNLAFTSAKRLFFTMGHEFIHVSQYASLTGLSTDIVSRGLLDFHAYSYEYNVLGSGNYGGFTPSDARQLMLQYPNYFQSLNYMNFPWTTRASYIYPF